MTVMWLMWVCWPSPFILFVPMSCLKGKIRRYPKEKIGKMRFFALTHSLPSTCSTWLGAPTRALQGRLMDTVDTTSNDIRSDIQMIQIPKSRSGLCKPRLFVGSTGHTPHQMTPVSSLILAFLVKKNPPFLHCIFLVFLHSRVAEAPNRWTPHHRPRIPWQGKGSEDRMESVSCKIKHKDQYLISFVFFAFFFG